MGNKIFDGGHCNGKSYEQFLSCIKEALKGKVVMYATPKGNIAILQWDKIKNIKF